MSKTNGGRDARLPGQGPATTVTAPTPSERLLEAKPGAPITVSYRVVSAFQHEPLISEMETYVPLDRRARSDLRRGPVCVPRRASDHPFYRRARRLRLLRPAWSARTKAAVDRLGPDPERLRGRRGRDHRREVAGARVRVATIGKFGFADEAFGMPTMTVIAGQRAFWVARKGPSSSSQRPWSPCLDAWGAAAKAATARSASPYRPRRTSRSTTSEGSSRTSTSTPGTPRDWGACTTETRNGPTTGSPRDLRTSTPARAFAAIRTFRSASSSRPTGINARPDTSPRLSGPRRTPAFGAAWFLDQPGRAEAALPARFDPGAATGTRPAPHLVRRQGRPRRRHARHARPCGEAGPPKTPKAPQGSRRTISRPRRAPGRRVRAERRRGGLAARRRVRRVHKGGHPRGAGLCAWLQPREPRRGAGAGQGRSRGPGLRGRPARWYEPMSAACRACPADRPEAWTLRVSEGGQERGVTICRWGRRTRDAAAGGPRGPHPQARARSRHHRGEGALSQAYRGSE